MTKVIWRKVFGYSAGVGISEIGSDISPVLGVYPNSSAVMNKLAAHCGQEKDNYMKGGT